MKAWQQHGLNSQPDANAQQHKNNVKQCSANMVQTANWDTMRNAPQIGAHRPGSGKRHMHVCLQHVKGVHQWRSQHLEWHPRANPAGSAQTHTSSSREAANRKQNEDQTHIHLKLGNFDRVQKRKQASTSSHIGSAANSTAESIAKYMVIPSKAARQRGGEKDNRSIQSLLRPSDNIVMKCNEIYNVAR